MLDYAMTMLLKETGETPHEENGTSFANNQRQRVTVKTSHSRSYATCKRYPRLPSSRRPRKFRALRFTLEDLAKSNCVTTMLLSHIAGDPTSQLLRRAPRNHTGFESRTLMELTSKGPTAHQTRLLIEPSMPLGQLDFV
jgi:hypothetical protein